LSVVGCRLSVVGCRLSVVGCRLSVVGCRLSAISHPARNRRNAPVGAGSARDRRAPHTLPSKLGTTKASNTAALVERSLLRCFFLACALALRAAGNSRTPAEQARHHQSLEHRRSRRAELAPLLLPTTDNRQPTTDNRQPATSNQQPALTRAGAPPRTGTRRRLR